MRLQLDARRIVDLLSLYNNISHTLHPCACKNRQLHRIIIMSSSMLTNSALVLLGMLSFCFRDIKCMAPEPYDITAPMWLLKSRWTANDASTYHLTTCRLSAGKVKLSLQVPLQSQRSYMSLDQSSSVGLLTQVHITAIVGCKPGLVHWHTNSPLAMIVWNSSCPW